MEDTKTSDY
jgi:hypothetical protein